MQLFAVCQNPLLSTLENDLAGIQIGGRRIKTTVIAYTDDVTITNRHPKKYKRHCSVSKRRQGQK